jgi:hypothetical protein
VVKFAGAHCGLRYSTVAGLSVFKDTIKLYAFGCCKGTKEGNRGPAGREANDAELDTQAVFIAVLELIRYRCIIGRHMKIRCCG